ncbi:hypothetical protein D8B26_007876 [Coccidioides posadasii str. Silveira]|uniref:Thioesterase n=2 Tax=Coccidioides posadasii TaxID=199306 RepID=E9D1K6_COCPS|nr:thioesterase [Coccidioides posadasii str. Silveira]KMM72133.1 thioesterase superfamily [Coccidioides posadasii RMSCC 3488]QVM13263.1 hypothetical protein D8B26_007876 [Coccidioides posadasii str. Silveira]
MALSELEQKKRRTRNDYTYQLEYRTRWSDNDMYGHMNNSIYAFLFDSIINTYLIENCGLNPFSSRSSSEQSPDEQLARQGKLQRPPQIGLVVSSFCDFFASVSFPDVLELGLRVTKLGKSSVTYEVGVFRKGEEPVKVVGGFTHVFVDKVTMKPTSDGMVPAIRKGLERLALKNNPGSKL